MGVERPYANVHGNFKIKFQTYIFEIICKDNFLRLMFAYTTSDVYLSLRFKFWNIIVWFDYQIFVVHHKIFEIYILIGKVSQ
jgi:hypothetical protein